MAGEPCRTLQPTRERGQVMTEYIMITAFALMVLTVPVVPYQGGHVSIVAYLLYKAGEFYLNLIHVICIPVP